MNILFLDTPAFAKQDMLDAFEAYSIHCTLFSHANYNERTDKAFETAFFQALECGNYDFVFSFNYFPILSNCCQKYGIKYISYVYDSPLVALYSCSLINPCNHVFLFDKATYHTFKNAGITTVHYLPLAANVERLSAMQCPKASLPTISSEVSFVGSLYNEEHNFYDRLQNISPYTRGYLEAIMAAQQRIYGSFILEGLLTPPVLADLQQALPYTPMPDGAETAAYVYANYFLCRKITYQERVALLKTASEHFQLKLFTHTAPPELPDAHFIGPVDWYDTMPYIFKESKINLNISLKSIQTGIPLRCMDIMGCGGFLLTNYQSDLLEHFIPGEDFVFYESEDDFLAKITYYLSHESERKQIAQNGLEKMKNEHTFLHRVKFILDQI